MFVRTKSQAAQVPAGIPRGHRFTMGSKAAKFEIVRRGLIMTKCTIAAITRAAALTVYFIYIQCKKVRVP